MSGPWATILRFSLTAAWWPAPSGWPTWGTMWALAAAVFFVCKGLTLYGSFNAPLRRRIAYLTLWPGLDATAFLIGARPLPSQVTEWLFAAAKTLFGVATLWTVLPALDGLPNLLRGWVGMVGIVFVLHFGTFHLLSCGWRTVGIAARPMMVWPIAATGVADFWGRRWNTAFRDLTHRFLFRPLATRFGPWGAALAGFGFSGVVHDAVISWPAAAGYGGPTMYFLIQAAGLLVERSRLARHCGLGRGVVGRLFAAAVVVGPTPLLFHPPFVRRVVVPFLQAVGAW